MVPNRATHQALKKECLVTLYPMPLLTLDAFIILEKQATNTLRFSN